MNVEPPEKPVLTALRKLHDLIPGAGPLDKRSELFELPCRIHDNCTAYATTAGAKISLCCDQGAVDDKEFVKRLNLPTDALRKVGLAPPVDGKSLKPRSLSPQFNNIPDELKALDQWVLWRWEQRKDKKGVLKWTKPPYRPDGKKAESDDPTTWSTFNQVRAALTNGGNFSGIGSVISETDSFVGLDCDHCLDAQLQIIDPLVAWIVELLDTYTEVSPSRDGLKLWVLAKKPGKRCSVQASFGEIALYDKERFFTITGEVWPPGSDPKPIAHRQAELETIYQTLFPKKATGKKQPVQTSPLKLDDAQLLDLARKAKDGGKFVALYDHGEIEAYGNDDSRADAALCSLLAFWTGRDAARMDSLFRRSTLMRDKWYRDDYRERTIEYAIGQCDEIYTPPPPMPDEPEYVQSPGNTLIIDDAEGNGPPPPPAGTTNSGSPPPPNSPTSAAPQQPPGDPRPIIQVRGGRRPWHIRQAEEILLQDFERYGLYRHGDALVHSGSWSTEDRARSAKLKLQHQITVERPIGVAVLRMASPPMLDNIFGRAIRWQKFNERKTRWFDVDTPDKLSRQYIESGDWQLPWLTGIINSPVVRPDGSILTELGYDRKTGLLLRSDLQWTAPADLSQAEASRAASTLCELFSDFPFESSPVALSVVISAILTGIQRRLLPTASAHAFDANNYGAGKTLLADVVSIIVTGSEAPKITFGGKEDEAEFKKLLVSVLLAGDPIVLLDNITRPVKSESFASALTGPTFGGRILGINQEARLPTNCLFLETGNNLSFPGEMARRTLCARIQTPDEYPDQRAGFKIADLKQYCREHRQELVSCALTIIAGYAQAGRPAQNIPPYGSFEQYSRDVRSAMVWAGLDDPVKSRLELSEADPEREEMLGVFENWFAQFADDPVLVRDLIDRANKWDPDDGWENPDFREALLTVARKGKDIDSHLLGYWCRGHKGKPIVANGKRYQLLPGKHSRGGGAWRVERKDV
jgi:hypothetical protein